MYQSESMEMTILGNSLQSSRLAHAPKQREDHLKNESTAHINSTRGATRLHSGKAAAKKAGLLGLSAATVLGVGITAKKTMDKNAAELAKTPSHFAATVK